MRSVPCVWTMRMSEQQHQGMIRETEYFKYHPLTFVENLSDACKDLCADVVDSLEYPNRQPSIHRFCSYVITQHTLIFHHTSFQRDHHIQNQLQHQSTTSNITPSTCIHISHRTPHVILQHNLTPPPPLFAFPFSSSPLYSLFFFFYCTYKKDEIREVCHPQIRGSNIRGMLPKE